MAPPIRIMTLTYKKGYTCSSLPSISDLGGPQRSQGILCLTDPLDQDQRVWKDILQIGKVFLFTNTHFELIL